MTSNKRKLVYIPFLYKERHPLIWVLDTKECNVFTGTKTIFFNDINKNSTSISDQS